MPSLVITSRECSRTGLNKMKKIKIDANFLGAFSTCVAPLTFLCERISQFRCSGQENYKKSYHLWSKHLFSVEKKRERCLISKKRNMDEDCNYSDIFPSEESLLRRSSTIKDLQLSLALLKEILEYRNKNVSSWIIEVSSIFNQFIYIMYLTV